MIITLYLPDCSCAHTCTCSSTDMHEERLGNIFRELQKTGSHPGLNQGPLTLVVSALPPELWPPGDSQPSQFSISLCMYKHVCTQSAIYMYLSLLFTGVPIVMSELQEVEAHYIGTCPYALCVHLCDACTSISFYHGMI